MSMYRLYRALCRILSVSMAKGPRRMSYSLFRSNLRSASEFFVAYSLSAASSVSETPRRAALVASSKPNSRCSRSFSCRISSSMSCVCSAICVSP